LTYALTADDYILDFVLLVANRASDLHDELIANNPYARIAGGVPSSIAQVWSTNRAFGLSGPTDGIAQQLNISLGNISTAYSDWRSLGLATVATPTEKDALVNSFRTFCGLVPLPGGSFSTNNLLTMETPFNPAAKLSVAATWQANDPLVHHHAGDLSNSFYSANVLSYLKPSQPSTNLPPSTLGFLNFVYSPWGGNPAGTYELPGSYDRSIHDPGVYSADDWDFPTNEPLSARWLGRVHRGTPWQTIYLKADVAPISLWANQSSDLRAHPTNDWRLVELLASLLNTNDVRTLTSINITNAGELRNTFAGLRELSNNVTVPLLRGPVTYETNVIVADAPQLGTVLAGIDRERAARAGEYFRSVAEFLSVPELSSASAWLNLTGDQPKWGVTDEGYESLPSQLLALVRADPVGSATFSVNGIQLRFATFDGYAHRVEMTTNFIEWRPVSEPHYSTNGVLTINLPASGGSEFYRAVLLPAADLTPARR
jgi:hypothetical protein